MAWRSASTETPDAAPLSLAPRQVVGAVGGAGLLLSPWIAVLGWRSLGGGDGGVTIVDWIPEITPEAIRQLFTLFTFGYARGWVPYWSLEGPPAAFFLVPALSLALVGLRRGLDLEAVRSAERLRDLLATDVASIAFVVCWLVVPVVIAYVVSQLVVPVFAHRYLIVAAPAMTVLLARGVAALPHVPVRYLFAALLLTGMCVPLPGYYAADQKEPWNDVTAHVEAEAQPGDTVVLVPEYVRHPFGYSFARDDVAVQPVHVETDDETLAAVVAGDGDVFLVTAHLDDDDRDRFVRRTEAAAGGTVTERESFDRIDVYRIQRDR